MRDKYQVMAIVMASIVLILGCLWIGTYIKEFQVLLIQAGRGWYIVVAAIVLLLCALKKK